MKYDAFIDQVHRNVREESAWPTSTSATQEQIDLAYIAALAVMSDVPLSQLSTSEETLTGTGIGSGSVKKYPLPADIIDTREDLGMAYIDVDGDPIYPHRFMPVESVMASGDNSIQSASKYAALDVPGKIAFVTGATAVKFVGALTPDKPPVGDIGTADYPLSGLKAERAVQIVSMHINGVTIRDSAAAQFNALLQKQYAGGQNG